MTRKHSAAPWRHVNEDGEPVRGKYRKFPICYMDTGAEIYEADIRLICAAPELLKALLGLLEQIESLKGESSCMMRTSGTARNTARPAVRLQKQPGDRLYPAPVRAARVAIQLKRP